MCIPDVTLLRKTGSCLTAAWSAVSWLASVISIASVSIFNELSAVCELEYMQKL